MKTLMLCVLLTLGMGHTALADCPGGVCRPQTAVVKATPVQVRVATPHCAVQVRLFGRRVRMVPVSNCGCGFGQRCTCGPTCGCAPARGR